MTGGRENVRGFRRVVALAALAWCLARAPGTVSAQGNPIISAATDRLNTIAPQAVPQQTIRVGTFNGANNTFNWLLPEYCPAPNPNKCEDRGGDIPLQHFSTINSFNVKYEFSIVNRPSNFQLTLRVPDGAGNVVDKVATLNPAGTLASVTFNVHGASRQTVIIRRSGGQTQFTITTRLAEQLGAFVVPYMLISIVYEPPGDYSSASYSRTSTAGTVISWTFARTSGLWETVNPDQMRELFLQAAAAGVGYFNQAAGAAITVINQLWGHTDIETTRTNTKGVSSSKGWSISVTEEFVTSNQDAYKYPGQGDRFIILRDVLFVYLLKAGKVYLAPMAYSKPVRGLGAYQLTDLLPPPVAAKFSVLDPLVGDRVRMLGLLARIPIGGVTSRVPRFRFFDTYACEQAGPNIISLKRHEFSSSGVYETVSETVVEKATGLLASMAGSGSNVYGYSYSSSVEQLTGDEEVASISLFCGPNDGPSGFEVNAYFDTLFRTFLSVRGQPLEAAAAMQGTVSDQTGHPMAKHKVTLIIGDQRYSVFTDQKGTFSFRFKGLPKGSGSLIVGKSSSPITYTGAPISGLKLRVASGALPGVRLPVR